MPDPTTTSPALAGGSLSRRTSEYARPPMTALLLSASVTPLKDGGAALDEDAIGPLVEFLQAGGGDGGVFCGATGGGGEPNTGEGVQLTTDERRRALLRFREACTGTVIVHCGAQTTAETVALAGHAAASG